MTAFGEGPAATAPGEKVFDFTGELAEEARAIRVRDLTLRVKVGGEEREAHPAGVELGGAPGGSGAPSRDLRFNVLLEVGEESVPELEGITGSVTYYTVPPAPVADPRFGMFLADMGSTPLRDGAAVVYDVSRQQPIETPDAYGKFMEEFDKDFGKFVELFEAEFFGAGFEDQTDAKPAAEDDFEAPGIPDAESKLSLQFQVSPQGSRVDLYHRLGSGAILGRILLLRDEPGDSVDRVFDAASANPSRVLFDRRMFVPLDRGVGVQINAATIEASALDKAIQEQVPVRVVLGFVKGVEMKTASFSYAMPAAAARPKGSGGRLGLNGETVELRHAAAYRAELFSEEVIGVTLTERKATADQIQSSEFPGVGLELLFRPDGKLVYVSAKTRTEERRADSGVTARTEFLQRGVRVTGRAVLDDPTGDLSFDVRFDEKILGGGSR